MEPRRPQGAAGGGRPGLSYDDLFNLESLVSFRLPLPEESDQCVNSSEDASSSSQGHCDGVTNAPSNQRNRKLHPEANRTISNSSVAKGVESSSDRDDYDHEKNITEDDYRSMLGKHVMKYKKARHYGSFLVPESTQMASPLRSHKKGLRTKFDREPWEQTPTRELEGSMGYNGRETDTKVGGLNSVVSALDSSFLDIDGSKTYRIPPGYDKLAVELNLPDFSDVQVEEHFLEGMLDLRSLAAVVTHDKRAKADNWVPWSSYESLQVRVKSQKMDLRVIEDPFAIPEGAAGRIRRIIMSESGALQVFYVKVLEKGDTYEIIERSLPKKQIMKKDASVIEKEETDKIGKIWLNIARRDIPRHHRTFTNFHKKLAMDAKRLCENCQREVKLKISRSVKLMRSAALRTRKLARDMAVFWKRMDKEQAELRKKEERDAAEAMKKEEELREAKRQQQRLNFLLSQTELYSHFMQNKSGEYVKPSERVSAQEPLEGEDPEEVKLREDAIRAAEDAVAKQKKITDAFDNEFLRLRKVAESSDLLSESIVGESSDMNLLNPSTMPEQSSVKTPELFKGTLKEYQLKGLQWLVNCYEQGLNGILADEMGLGKTIQAMAFLAHLAEEKNIWGPFLVVAPSSVLNNWAEELARFCPDLKALPYWGGLPERTVLRKNINPKRLYRRDSSFHILITSYQLLVTDEKHLRRVKWQYMLLDEAQAIKSSNSIRWKTLLSFSCRNRLLLTGTPIQNNMQELWALLHFIMPTLFDSHEQFSEWFAKGIESHAEHGGTLNEHQLNRLHAVLKPFMLRRVKKDVITEMTGKVEVTVHCELSSRQHAFYQAVKNKISLSELFDGKRGHWNEKKLVNLMNIVMQLRKVCNHPELFERNEGRSYLYFADIPNSLQSPPFGELEDVHYAGEWNPISLKIPKLVYQDLISGTELAFSGRGDGTGRRSFSGLFDIFSPSYIHYSVVPQFTSPTNSFRTSNVFGFSRMLDLSPAEVSFLARCGFLERLNYSALVDEILAESNHLYDEHIDNNTFRAVARMLLLPTKSQRKFLQTKVVLDPDSSCEALVVLHRDRLMSNTRLLRATYAFIPKARAPPINVNCSDRNFSYKLVEELHHPWTKRLLVGFARTSIFNGPREPISPNPLINKFDTCLLTSGPALQLPYRIFGSSPPVSNFDPAKMLTDSGKLQTLDVLLRRLRAENHRVLLFAQMTKMLDILEDYMNFRKYKYFRLDGSSSIVDRRDMVRDFQCRNDVFVFLLSTRAGGLGINLTAADTVIFYEIDWNPTLDMQAMDRAHRLGQTKEVMVYRLICKDTIEEKILQRANQKNTVQQLVMTGKHVQGDQLKQEDFVSLLIDDKQLEQKLKEISMQANDRQKRKRGKVVKVDADGDLTLEDLNNFAMEGADQGKASVKKRKVSTVKKSSRLHGAGHADMIGDDGKDYDGSGNDHAESESLPDEFSKDSKRLRLDKSLVNQAS